jgi:inner membrane protein
VEPITHFLTGACMGRAGFNRTTALATATMTLAAEAPDLDMLGQFKDPVFGFAHHRGFTHSFLGLFLVSGLVVGFMYLLWRLRGRPMDNPKLPPRWARLFLYAYLAGLTHILLDFTNNYGVRPFWPFSEKWYSWDIVFIADPFLWLFLVAGLLVPTFFSLVDRELGVRPKAPAGRIGATLALLGVLLVWGVRDYQHRRAVSALKAYLYEKAEPIRASAYPNWWNPFSWNGVVETQNFYATASVDSLQPEVDPAGEMQVLYKPEETAVTLAAKNSGLGRVYLDWAQYPYTETEPIQSPRAGYLVRFIDLRYSSPQFGARRSLSAGVELDENLRVVEEIFGNRRRSVPK